MAVAKKKTASTEAVVGNAALQVARSLSALKDATATFEKIAETIEEKQYIVADLEEKIKGLETTFAESARAGKIKVDLDMQAYQLEAAKTVATANGMSLVKTNDYTQLQNDYTTLKNDFAKKVATEVNAATHSIANDYNNKAALKDAEFKATAAKMQAELDTAKAQVAFLTDQVSMWKGQLESERTASVERSKASAIGSVNVSGASK